MAGDQVRFRRKQGLKILPKNLLTQIDGTVPIGLILSPQMPDKAGARIHQSAEHRQKIMMPTEVYVVRKRYFEISFALNCGADSECQPSNDTLCPIMRF